MSPDRVLPPPICPLPTCPMEPAIAVNAVEVANLKAAVEGIKKSVGRIEAWTIGALGSLVLLSLTAIFKLLQP